MPKIVIIMPTKAPAHAELEGVEGQDRCDEAVAGHDQADQDEERQQSAPTERCGPVGALGHGGRRIGFGRRCSSKQPGGRADHLRW
jgi:hypothetical protein